MRKYCCVKTCKNNNLKTDHKDSNLKFYSFPANNPHMPWLQQKRTDWINALKKYAKQPDDWVPGKYALICSIHFVGNEKSEHPSHPSYLPMLFDGNKIPKDCTQNIQRWKRQQQRAAKLEKNNSKTRKATPVEDGDPMNTNKLKRKNIIQTDECSESGDAKRQQASKLDENKSKPLFTNIAVFEDEDPLDLDKLKKRSTGRTAAKGNSIFAEVEDKRQEMANNLILMKQTNSRLRKELANKQAEVDVLLREKRMVWEQQIGTIAHYDRELIESYEERITQLESLCERQRRELAKWFGKLCEPTANGWLPGVLDHLKSECEQLREEVLSRGAAQLASAALVRELRRKLAAVTANGARESIGSPKDDLCQEDKIDAVQPKVIVKKATVDDVKKKVSFN